MTDCGPPRGRSAPTSLASLASMTQLLSMIEAVD
jgi:hypothetical protein